MSIILDQNIKTKIRPVLIPFSGQPKSGKSLALAHLLNNYVDKNPFKLMTQIEKNEKLEAEGISYYELVAAGFNTFRNLSIAEVTKESSCAFGILSAFKHDYVANGRVPLFNNSSDRNFSDLDLENHLQHIFKYLLEIEHFPKGDELSEEKCKFAKYLQILLPDGIALINIWDLAINKTVLHFLTALCGHLYNSHMWLFLDLEEDLKNIDKPPEILPESTASRREEAVLMKWRPRLHYLLRSCRMSKNINGKRRRVCTLFAKHSGMSFNEDLQEKVEELEDKVQQAAKVIGVSHLLEEKIEVTNLGDSGRTGDADSSRRLYHKFQQIICETPYADIPLSWVFLRSLFYYSQKKFISKHELTEKAKQCGMNEKSLTEFCKFYTSFGSIFDLSLVNPQYEYVVVKPMGFLKSLDKFLIPSENITYPSMQFGIVPEKAFKQEFEEDSPAYIDALVCLNLAAVVESCHLEQSFDSNETHYYIPLSRDGEPTTDLDTSSVHLITSISTPHVFKQTSFANHLLHSLFQSKLLLCASINKTIIKDESTDTIITLVSHSPVTRLHISRPNADVCSHIVKAYNEIAESCTVGTTQYKFVKICARSDITNVQSIPSCQYHVLPDDVLCEDCVQDGRKDDILFAWNEALKRVRDRDNDVIKTWNTAMQKSVQTY